MDVASEKILHNSLPWITALHNKKMSMKIMGKTRK